jgi:hypothetical protein
MKRQQMAMLAAAVCLALAGAARAQMGMDFFKKPSIADIFKPVVGAGAVYENEQDQKKGTLEMSVVAKDAVDGKEAYWLEFGRTDPKNGTMGYAKMLVTKDDFQFHRMIVQRPGQPQPLEIDMNPGMRQQSHMQAEVEKWHKVGSETITVPAGTFSCDHWAKDDGKGDVWASSKVSPMSLVKQTSPGHSMVLVKVLIDAQDHITGTPMKMDPQQMMQQRQQQKPQPNP